jgi:hypothetical protein
MEQRREARLRPEYASWYPGVTVAGWVPASTVARRVTRQLLHGEPRWAPRWEVGLRILDERHFLFRLGVARDPTLRTRAGDSERQE